MHQFIILSEIWNIHSIIFLYIYIALLGYIFIESTDIPSMYFVSQVIFLNTMIYQNVIKVQLGVI